MITLRKLTREDWPLMMAWRSIYAVYDKGCYTQNTHLKWEEHFAWMNCRGPWWKFYIIQVTDVTGTRPVGVVNFGQLDNWNPEFNYYLGEVSLWGQGVATEALKIGLNWLRKHGYMKCHTTTRDDNDKGIGTMINTGFVKTGAARPGESVWECVLGEKDEATEYTAGRKPFMET